MAIKEPIYITNACLCHPDKNDTPIKEMIEACRPRLIAEVLKNKPKAVIVLGNTAIQSILPGEGGVTAIHGLRFFSEELGTNVFPGYHPAFILRNPDAFRDLTEDIAAVQRFIDDPRIEVGSNINFKVCTKVSDVLQMVKHIEKTRPDYLVGDIETTGYSPVRDRFKCFGLASRPDEIWVLPSRVVYSDQGTRSLKKILENPELVWGGHNAAQFDAKFPRHQLGIDWKPRFDTMLAHYTLDERQGVHGLEDLARKYLGVSDWSVGIDHETIQEGPELFEYNAKDNHYTHRLIPLLSEEMDDESMTHVHDETLLPAARALGYVEEVGALIDQPYMNRIRAELQEKLDDQRWELQVLGAEHGMPDFNPNSPKQVNELLYDKLKLLAKRSTRRGSTADKEALTDLSHPIATQILEARQGRKLISTYVDGILKRLSPEGRIHSDFLLHGTVTGRLSSRDPNLQNIPARIGPLIRDAFIATPGWLFLEPDYSQLELRVAAYLSGDEVLTGLFKKGIDLHAAVAAHIFRVLLENVDKAQRHVGKTLNFGILYQMGAKSLAHDLHCSVKQAKAFIDAHLGQFPQLKEWIADIQALALKQGYVESAFGRKRRFPCILSLNKAEVMRQAVNAPISSTASDICLSALVRLVDILDPKDARIILTVHDSLLLEVRPAKKNQVIEVLRREMEENVPLDSPVPFKIDIKEGTRWGSLTKLKAA